ncbi:MAG: MFS transporter [Ardenticatenaceae bacterium]|nr:MFS transporter [Ardenticatenaceae bacterium]MCB8989948.1 MFS transporter [Ardenticatenaceae bacterium]MCB9005391.1 MFS transporter [Ardenticatenaceae bacterium]
MSDAVSSSPVAGQQLSRRTKFIYSLGDWGTSSATVARNTFWFIFLTNVVGIGAGLAGTVVLIGRIWDSINDPLVGMLSDRIQTRWGRRRPFLLFGAVPFGLAFFLMFYVPPIHSTAGLAVYYSLAFLLFDTLYTLVNVPYIALTPELTEDFDERSNLAGWRMGSSILAALVTAGTFTLLAEDVFGQWLGGDAAAIRSGYALTAALWGLTLTIPLLILFKYIEEPEREPDTDPLRPLQTFREVFSNRPFRYAAVIYLLSFTTVDVVLVVFVRFLVDYVRVDPGFDNLLLATVLALAFLSMPIVIKLMRRYGKRNTYIGSMVFMAIVLGILSQVPPGGQNVMLVAAIFAGMGYGAANAVPWAIVADVVEADELQTGKRREGIYAGYLVFFRKMASAFAIFMVGQLLAASGFVSSTGGGVYVQQPESALFMLRLLVSVIPALMLLFSVMVAWRYPLNREQFYAIQQELLAKRAAKK